MANALQTCRKHYGKRRNCSLRAISPFPTGFSFSHSVFKGLVLQTHKNQGLLGKGLKQHLIRHLQMVSSFCHLVKSHITDVACRPCYPQPNRQRRLPIHTNYTPPPPQMNVSRGILLQCISLSVHPSICPSVHKIVVSVKVLVGIFNHI